MTIVHIVIPSRHCVSFGTCDVIMMSLFSLNLAKWPPSAKTKVSAWPNVPLMPCMTALTGPNAYAQVKHMFLSNI